VAAVASSRSCREYSSQEYLKVILNLITTSWRITPTRPSRRGGGTLHRLNDFQHVKKLFQMDSLGGRKPSELLLETIGKYV
jgi:hypothetical protein